MCHHLAAMESEAKVMSVSCPGVPPPSSRDFSPPADLCTDTSSAADGLGFALSGRAFCNVARPHYWQNIGFETFEHVLISTTNLMMDSVVDTNSFLSIKHVTACSHNWPLAIMAFIKTVLDSVAGL